MLSIRSFRNATGVYRQIRLASTTVAPKREGKVWPSADEAVAVSDSTFIWYSTELDWYRTLNPALWYYQLGLEYVVLLASTIVNVENRGVNF